MPEEIFITEEARDYARALVDLDPEFANDLYFALDEIFVKKTTWHEELTKVVHNWVKSEENS